MLLGSFILLFVGGLGKMGYRFNRGLGQCGSYLSGHEQTHPQEKEYLPVQVVADAGEL